jgi:hypothetical protein
MRIIIAQELKECEKTPKGHRQLPTQAILDFLKSGKIVRK